MPYLSHHRPAVKKTIIDSARKLFNRHGFESVSIQQIMAGAGLTHGGFYSYFKARVISTQRSSPASSPTPIGKVAGKA
jgi:TetR/AcrR family transcriptional regulator, transcriptional repressor for nem operon